MAKTSTKKGAKKAKPRAERKAPSTSSVIRKAAERILRREGMLPLPLLRIELERTLKLQLRNDFLLVTLMGGKDSEFDVFITTGKAPLISSK